jgi:uncharacterized protein YlxW (UPF0749 family)
MSVFSGSAQHKKSWVWQVTALCLILGFLLSGSLRTVNFIRREGGGRERVGFAPTGAVVKPETVRKLEKEITELRERNTKLENSMSLGGGQLKALNEGLQQAKQLAGLTEVTGPGVVLTLMDSKKRPPSGRSFELDKYIIHDIDLQQVVNEMFASGAEAVAVKDQRVTSRTAIRCVGPTIQVNGVPISPPYVILAIGDSGTLAGGLNLPFGVLDSIRRYDPEMFKLETKTKITIPAYTGSTEMRYAKPTQPADKTETGKKNP